MTKTLSIDEQPYKIPDDWYWSTLGKVCTFIGGGTPSKRNSEYWNGNINWASVKDVKGDYLFDTIDKITEEGLKNSSANLCEINDLILVTRMAPGTTIISKIVTAINQDLKIVKSDLSTKFLHYFFYNIKQEVEMKSVGTTVNGIKVEILNEFKIAVPPLDEQQRIVERIESLFTKLDKAKEKLNFIVGFNDLKNTTIGKIDLIKKSILSRAFRGEL